MATITFLVAEPGLNDIDSQIY